ncbi:uncharacterized protein LOC117647087 [Thrips palmi]|uniref:Uncharacterized protein LOC117647087 n=1 Tax=Thrips palmi TaxID=161013 RepID=A0A6P8YWJ5_THRPL|nr:uncharacterized protein LOC117647087 [Thrips palmi]
MQSRLQASFSRHMLDARWDPAICLKCNRDNLSQAASQRLILAVSRVLEANNVALLVYDVRWHGGKVSNKAGILGEWTVHVLPAYPHRRNSLRYDDCQLYSRLKKYVGTRKFGVNIKCVTEAGWGPKSYVPMTRAPTQFELESMLAAPAPTDHVFCYAHRGDVYGHNGFTIRMERGVCPVCQPGW